MLGSRTVVLSLFVVAGLFATGRALDGWQVERHHSSSDCTGRTVQIVGYTTTSCVNSTCDGAGVDFECYDHDPLDELYDTTLYTMIEFYSSSGCGGTRDSWRLLVSSCGDISSTSNNGFYACDGETGNVISVSCEDCDTTGECEETTIGYLSGACRQADASDIGAYYSVTCGVVRVEGWQVKYEHSPTTANECGGDIVSVSIYYSSSCVDLGCDVTNQQSFECWDEKPYPENFTTSFVVYNHYTSSTCEGEVVAWDGFSQTCFNNLKRTRSGSYQCVGGEVQREMCDGLDCQKCAYSLVDETFKCTYDPYSELYTIIRCATSSSMNWTVMKSYNDYGCATSESYFYGYPELGCVGQSCEYFTPLFYDYQCMLLSDVVLPDYGVVIWYYSDMEACNADSLMGFEWYSDDCAYIEAGYSLTVTCVGTQVQVGFCGDNCTECMQQSFTPDVCEQGMIMTCSAPRAAVALIALAMILIMLL
ncbi:hypothetical protein Pelo_1826 [Pelomyxa schiedti]|nr:hypothetical protein Pelo_1826 [Pelomyxa schiedti]